MKIAMIGHKRIPGREGGVEVVVEELAVRMAAMGNEVDVYNRKKKGLKIPTLYKGTNVIEIFTIEKKSTDAVVYSFLASICAAFKKYDIIHYHALGPSAFLIIPYLFRKKIVVTVHGLNYLTPKWSGLGEKFIKLGEKITAKYANQIIVLSQKQKEYFKLKYNRDTIFIPNGTEMKDILEADIIEKEYGLEKNGYILFVSRVVPGKGLEYLLEAYKQIDSDFPLIVAGGSVYVDEFYERILELAKQDERVRLIGFVEGQKLQELYSNAKLFVFPSEAEGMPMCLLEALSYDCACLVSDIPENTEVGAEYVQTFKSTDIEDLKKNLANCLQNTEQIFNKSSRKMVQQKYDWNAVVRQTLQCYEL